MMQPGWIDAEWPAPPGVRAGTTTRDGGVSTGPYASLNLADHVGDEADAVAENRKRLVDSLRDSLGFTGELLWLRQVHGCGLATVGRDRPGTCADASYADKPGNACVVLTADCLPVLITNRSGTRAAAAHAGWRGLAAGVLGTAVARFPDAPADLMAWLGPAIGPGSFEVGADVRDAFVTEDPGAAGCFVDGGPGHWLADLYALARRRLAALGVNSVYGGEYCTVSDPRRFYSYRRDGATGRMASLIWVSG
ncbi:MAG: peptidoglycan editing factor PgeF [Pseudomonadota bacterium]